MAPRPKGKDTKTDKEILGSSGVAKNPRGSKSKGDIAGAVKDANKRFENGNEEQQAALQDQMRVTRAQANGINDAAQTMEGVEANADSDNDEEPGPNVKEEGADNDGLFVDDLDGDLDGNESTSDSLKITDDGRSERRIGFVSGFTKNSARKNENGTLVDVFKLRGGYVGIFQQGPEHSAIFEWRTIADGEKQLEDLRNNNMYWSSLIRSTADERSAEDKAKAYRGNVVKISGVARQSNLCPTAWKKDKNGKIKPPLMRIIAVWDNEENGPKSWEWRSDLKDFMSADVASRRTISAPEQIKYKGVVVLRKDAPVHPSDFDIFLSAVLYLEQYDKWKARTRTKPDDHRRTPAPVSFHPKNQTKPESEEEQL